MKKVLFVALAAAAMISCSENEEFENESTKAEIKFGTVVKTGTRAAVADNTNFKAFTVNGYITAASADIAVTGLGTAYMNEVNYSGGKGSWTPVIQGDTYYWPVNEEMYFFAYPTDAVSAYTTPVKGYPTFSYTVGADAASQKDLVVASAKVATKPSNNILNLTFKHILTRINFSYKPEVSGYTYTISDITIKGVAGGTATYTYGVDAVGTWSTPATPSVDYSYPVIIGTTADANNFYSLDSADGSLMLFPQNVAGKTISITYKTEKDGHVFFDSAKTVTLPEDAVWGVGQNIRYKLTLPVSDAPISFETEVETVNETDGPLPQ